MTWIPIAALIASLVALNLYGLFTYWLPAKRRPAPPTVPLAKHTKLPPTRPGIIRKTVIGTTPIYLRTGIYPNGELAEVFITIDKEGKAMRVYDCLAICLSLGLQHGIPLKTFIDKLGNQSMEPSGVTSDPDVPLCKSIPDYVMRKLSKKYLP